MDVVYTLIGFTLGLIIIAIQIITGGLTTGVEAMVGMAFYPILYNTYQSVYSQLPSNATQLQDAVNESFQNSVTYISEANTYAAMAINTLAMVLEIIAVIGAFIIILQLLMALAIPRNEVVPAGY
jgi:hypothetical protein